MSSKQKMSKAHTNRTVHHHWLIVWNGRPDHSLVLSATNTVSSKKLCLPLNDSLVKVQGNGVERSNSECCMEWTVEENSRQTERVRQSRDNKKETFANMVDAGTTHSAKREMIGSKTRKQHALPLFSQLQLNLLPAT